MPEAIRERRVRRMTQDLHELLVGGLGARCSAATRPNATALGHVAAQLYGIARRVRVFVAEPVAIPTSRVMALVERTPTEVAEALENAAALLS